MEALILSCGTGGGHNTAAQAAAEEWKRRGHSAVFLDPYQLVGDRTAVLVGNLYIKLVQKAPWLFGLVYSLGQAYRRLPFRSPVYWANGKVARYMEEFLDKHHFDVIIMTHIFPAQILANLKRRGRKLPKTILIATDYTCIPFMEESDCDYYIAPSPELVEEFCSYGIPRERILPYGIPVRQAFLHSLSQEEAREKLGLDQNRRYLLLSGGSIGAGKMAVSVLTLQRYLREHPECSLIIICGNNEALHRRLSRLYAGHSQMKLIKSTPDMAWYMKACDVFITKPGGLSSTEAAVAGVPLIHMPPIPGCETKNVAFFSSHAMSAAVRSPRKELLPLLERFRDPDETLEMRQAQSRFVNRQAAKQLCDLMEASEPPLPQEAFLPCEST